MSSVREGLKKASAKYVLEEEFEVEGQRLLAIGLVSGEKNRLRQECKIGHGEDLDLYKFSPRLVARTIHYPDTRELVWNGNDLTHLEEINALAEEVLGPMTAAASRVCGWGREAVEAGKSGSETESINSDSSSPPVSAEA